MLKIMQSEQGFPWISSKSSQPGTYAQTTAGSSDEHTYVAPDLFTADTFLGTY